jgi:AbrB family looped-hinge helix DNA binding protein
MIGTNVSAKGQVTIPKDIRKAIGLKTGDRVTFVADGDKVLMFPVRGDVLSLKGILKPYNKRNTPLSVVEMHEAAKAYVVERWNGKRQGR